LYKVGSGFDIHKLIKDKELVIGGVLIPSDKGFLAHSDGDIVVHALCDALLGAMGLKDIGTYFPDNDNKWKQCSSISKILPEVMLKVKEHKWKIQNIDINIIIDKPKMAPYIDKIKESLDKVLNIGTENISIKAKRTEECIFPPDKEAAIAMVTLLLEK